LAYIFSPVYDWVHKRVKNKSLSTALILLLFFTIVIVPAWFIIPKIAEQVFEVFKYLQVIDINPIIDSLFKGVSPQLSAQISAAFSSLTSKVASGIISTLLNFFVEVPNMIINLFVAMVVFFFALRDKDRLKEFVSGLSPLSKSKEELFIREFKDITDSIVYGQVIIGAVQGILAGVGFFVMGVPNAFVLTILAVILSIIPMIGPMFVWIPVTFYLFATSQPYLVIIFLLYNIFIVSTVDNLLRMYLLSRSTRSSTAVVLVGMIGGLFLFGVLGLILGPLILEYFVIFLKAYKEKKWASLFAEE
jgi:predicted PurR-regulated permease PerM